MRPRPRLLQCGKRLECGRQRVVRTVGDQDRRFVPMRVAAMGQGIEHHPFGATGGHEEDKRHVGQRLGLIRLATAERIEHSPGRRRQLGDRVGVVKTRRGDDVSEPNR